MKTRIRNLALSLFGLAALIAASAAPAAANPAALRPNVTVEAALVTLGDLFENLEADAASIPVFRAPDPGQSGYVSAERVAEAAQQHGVAWHNNGLHAKVTVTRASTFVTVDAVQRVVEAAVRERIGSEPGTKLAISFNANARSFHLHPDASGQMRILRLELDRNSGNFSAHVKPADGPGQLPTFSYSGRVVETVEMPVLARTMLRGEVVASDDVRMSETLKARVPADAIRTPADMVGLAMRRTVGEGQSLSAEDLERPRLIRRNQPVTIVYETGGLALSTRGRAMADAAQGDVVTVMNLRSKRMIDAVALTADRVAVIGAEPARRTASAAPAQGPAGRN